MDDLRRQARWAYEQTRLQNALPWAASALVFAAVAWSTLGAEWLAVALSAVLVVGLRWWGGDAGRAVPIGIAAGALGLLGPVAYGAMADPCAAACATCWSYCAASGVGMGVWLAQAVWRGPGTPSFVLSLASVAAFTAGIGCCALGVVGVLGVAIGVAFVPPMWAARTVLAGAR